MSNTSDFIIGLLIGAVITLIVLTIKMYLRYVNKKKDYDQLYQYYWEKSDEYKALVDRYDWLLIQYEECKKEIEDVKR